LPEARRAPRWRRLGALGLLLVPVLGLLELGAHLGLARRPPTEAQWRAAREPILATRKAGDLVVVAPGWAEPIARMVLGDEAMPAKDVARADESGYATALEVSILGQRSAFTRGWPELERRKQGKFELRRLKNPHHRPVLYDFVDELGPAAASVAMHDAQDQPCPWSERAAVIAGGLGGHPTFPARRFVCPGSSEMFAGVTIVEDQAYLPRRCIMMQTPARGWVEARFRDVPLGTEIRGHSGMRWLIERDGLHAPILLEVLVDGVKVGQEVHEDGQGWKGWRVPTGDRAGQRAEVAFRVSSANPAFRQMCWEASVR
jgi:hypothetical protein